MENEYNFEINRELKEIEKDKILNETELNNEKIKMSLLLNGEMGKDIRNVLDGKVKVKIPFMLKIKYKLNYFINKLFNAI